MKYKFFMPAVDGGVSKMLTKHGHSIMYSGDPKDADIAIFTGGEDVHPIFYGEDVLSTTMSNLRRDKREIKVFRSLPLTMPKVGICRGAQFLNVMSGGSMYQHVDGHLGSHEIDGEDWILDKKIKVSSTHHQMMRPSDEAWVMWTAQETRSVHTDSETIDTSHNADFVETELCYYTHTNSLCCQPHPEYEGYKELTEAFFVTIDYLFKDEIAKKYEPKQVVLPKVVT